MKINVANMLRMAGNDAGGAFRHSLPELADNLRELRDRSRAGDSSAALDEFFRIYVFGDGSGGEKSDVTESTNPDAERLDWLEQNGASQFILNRGGPTEKRWFDTDTMGSDFSETLRQAIDAARFK